MATGTSWGEGLRIKERRDREGKGISSPGWKGVCVCVYLRVPFPKTHSQMTMMEALTEPQTMFSDYGLFGVFRAF